MGYQQKSKNCGVVFFLEKCFATQTETYHVMILCISVYKPVVPHLNIISQNCKGWKNEFLRSVIIGEI